MAKQDLALQPQDYPGGSKRQRAAGCAEAPVPPSVPSSPLPEEGGSRKLPVHANFRAAFKWVWALAGEYPARGLCSGSFSCLIKLRIHCNSIPGNAWSKFTASQDLILPFRVTKSFAKLTLKSPNLAV